MPPLDDARWATLTEGYGDESDLRDDGRRLCAGDVDAAVWEESWLNLHHQDDVGTASCAVVPHMVETCAGRERDGAIRHACQAVEAARRHPGNPPLPERLRESCPTALNRSAGWTGAGLAGLDADERTILLAFLGQRAGLPELGHILLFSLDHEDFGTAMAVDASESKL